MGHEKIITSSTLTINAPSLPLISLRPRCLHIRNVLENTMNLNDLLHDIHALEDEIRIYERKCNILSDIFYKSYLNGEEPPDATWMLDWTAWASAYELLYDFHSIALPLLNFR